MDRLAQRVVEVLKPTLGDAAGLLLLREMKELGYKPPISSLSRHDREVLAHRVADNILGAIASPRRTSMFRSKLLSALEVEDRGVHSYGESSQWTH